MTDHETRKRQIWDSLSGYELFVPGEPRLFRSNDGSYLAGLARLWGAHICGGLPDITEHNFKDDKCMACGIHRRKK